MPSKEYPEPIIAQAVAVGERRNRLIGEMVVGESTIPVYYPKQVQLLIGTTAGTIYIKDTRLTNIDISTLPKIDLQDVPGIYGNEHVSPRSWTTVYKHGASKMVFPLIDRGNPNHKLTKPATSFRSSIIGQEIEAATSNPPEPETPVYDASDLDEIEF